MRLSDEGLHFIADEETFVGHVYVDFAGVSTIGYGHALRAGEKYTTLTESEALELLRLDVRTAEDAVNQCVRVPLTQTQFDALVSFTLNEGGGALASSTMLRLLNAGNFADAAEQFLVWDKYRDHGVVKVSPTLVARRRRERAVFLREPPAQPARTSTSATWPAAIIERERV